MIQGLMNAIVHVARRSMAYNKGLGKGELVATTAHESCPHCITIFSSTINGIFLSFACFHDHEKISDELCRVHGDKMKQPSIQITDVVGRPTGRVSPCRPLYEQGQG